MNDKKLIIKGHDKNPLVKFWNWGWGIYYKNPEVWNYLIVGFLTTVVSLVTYFVLTKLFLNPKVPLELQIANIISWVLSVSFAYVTNRVFVFKSKSEKILKEISLFVGSRVISLLMDMGIMFVVVSLLNGNDLIGKLLSQIVVIVANYVFSKLWVFKKR